MNKIPHVDAVKEILGVAAIEALTELFKVGVGSPASVPIDRFRADNQQWIEVLDDLERNKSLIERTKDCRNYLIRSYALPLIEDSKAIQLLDVMQLLVLRFKKLYSVHLQESLDIEKLVGDIEGDRELLLDALYYLTESHDIWSGKSIGFPYSGENSLCLSESSLSHNNIGDILGKYYEWHFLNPVKQLAINNNGYRRSAPDLKTNFLSRTENADHPDWYEKLDDVKKALIQEIEFTVIHGMSALPTIGLRTLIETVIVEKIGDKGDGFEKKLKRFKNEGFATEHQVNLLRSVLEVGNASAHRAYFPNVEDLQTCIDVVKHMLEGIYILHPKVKKVSDGTPKRKCTESVTKKKIKESGE